MDTYFRGDSHEVAFCERVGAGGNHLVAATAGGAPLGDGENGHVRLRQSDLAPLLAAFRSLPESDRRPPLPDPTAADPARRPVPDAPEGGLVIRSYCTYLEAGEGGEPRRATRLYYQQNPDAWAAETQSDMLWLTESEGRSLVPDTWEAGATREVPQEIQRRFFTTVGIDYMEGSVNALPLRESTMTLTVGKDGLQWIEGFGQMGEAYVAGAESEAESRGCELRVVGRILVDQATGMITAFDLAGLGRAWGNKMEYVRREIGLPGPIWEYGIACELVRGTAPDAGLPPYNLLHYGGGMEYFGAR